MSNESYDECLARLEKHHGVLPGSYVTCTYSTALFETIVTGLVVIASSKSDKIYILLSRVEAERLCQSYRFMPMHIINSKMIINKDQVLECHNIMEIEEMLDSSWDNIREVGRQLLETTLPSF